MWCLCGLRGGVWLVVACSVVVVWVVGGCGEYSDG